MQFKIEKTEHVNRTFRITKELADTLSEIAQREGDYEKLSELSYSTLPSLKKQLETEEEQVIDDSYAIIRGSSYYGGSNNE